MLSLLLMAPRAHPRSRGEHKKRAPVEEWVRGSSPLTRGARTFDGNPRRGDGLIPAHAGSTSMKR